VTPALLVAGTAYLTYALITAAYDIRNEKRARRAWTMYRSTK
jgi:hypothetical protein